jgi:hypothetical protein
MADCDAGVELGCGAGSVLFSVTMNCRPLTFQTLQHDG